MNKPGLTTIVTGLLAVFAISYSAAYAGQSQALIDAGDDGDLKQVRKLLDRGADVNTRGGCGGTVLMSASSIGHLAMVKLLLGKGADINAKDSNGGQTALMWAISMRSHPTVVALPWKGHPAIVKLLLARGADVNARNDKGWTALMWASNNCDLPMVKLLVKKGADVSARDNAGRTALTVTSQTNYINKRHVMKFLKAHGAED